MSSGASTSRVIAESPLPREPPVTRTEGAPVVGGRNFTPEEGLAAAFGLASAAKVVSPARQHESSTATTQSNLWYSRRLVFISASCGVLAVQLVSVMTTGI